MTKVQNILQTLGFEALTPMQEAMGKAVHEHVGVVLLSPTGSGKTLAYLLPLIGLINPALDALQAVVITPTRELAQQSEEVLRKTKEPVRALALYGGRPTMQEHRVVREVKPQIVFATPGRLNDHIAKENLNILGVRHLVIDEFDKSLELGFQAEMERAISQMPAAKTCWLMSATNSEAIPSFMNKVVKDFYLLSFLFEKTDLERRISLYEVKSPQKDKLQTLGRLLTHLHGAPAIVFVAHRESVDRIGNFLKQQGFTFAAYHGGMEQDIREQALYRFRNGSTNVLVCTDLAARGLDIPDVEAVIHYHLPLKAEEYTHRNGRTARWNAEGAIYLLTGPTETLPDYATEATPLEIEEELITPTPPHYATIYIGRGKRDKLSKGDILGFFCKKGGLRSAEIGRIDIGAHYAFVAITREKLRSVLRQVAGEKIKGMKTLIEETCRGK